MAVQTADTQGLKAELDAMLRLHELVGRLLECPDLQTALDEVLAATIEITGAQRGNVQMLTEQGGALEIVAQRGFDEAFLNYFRHVTADDGSACGRAMAKRERVIVEDVQRDPAFAEHLEIMRLADCRAVQSTPLLSRSGELLGVLSTHYSEPYRPSERELRTLDLYARQAADFIERVRADGELRYRGEQFETLIHQAPIGVYLVDGDFRIAQVNPVARPVFGDIPDLIGRDFDEVIHILWEKSYADEVSHLFRHTLDTGKPYETPERAEFRADRGVVEYYSWRINRITLPNGRYGVVCYFSDISEQVRARHAIAESEKKYHTLFESIDEGFCIFDMIFDDAGVPVDYRFVEYNPAFERLTGLTGAVGRTIREMVPGHEQHWIDTYGRVAQTGEPTRIEARAEGLGRWYDIYAFRIAEPEQRRVAALFSEVTERKNHEERIRFQARLLDTVGQAVVVTEPDGTIMYWNKAAEDLYGWSRDEAIGRSVIETTVAPDAHAPAQQIMNRLRAGESWSGEFQVQCKVETKPVIATLTPMIENGELEAIIGVSVDISELKAAQVALKDADRRKDEFLATLGHELRNPLAGIRMALRFAQQVKHDPQRVEQMTAIIDRQSAQLVRLIDDLLNVSRITRGKIGLRKRVLEVAPIIEQAIEGVRTECENQGITLGVALPSKPITIKADQVRIGQVISNVLHNACKYTPAGGRVDIAAQREGDEAVIRVRDTGIGIAKEKLPYVFEMFAQVDPERDRAKGGLGIGLALAKRLVEMHGGAIEARSEGLGEGSEFIIRLPIEEEAESESEEREPEIIVRGEGAVRAPNGPRKRILAVDDNRDALSALTEHLRMHGHEVHAVSNGVEALHAAGKHRPDALILDIGLPDVDGYEVARRIREQPWGRNIRIIAMTGWGQEEDKKRAAEAGFDVHLTKPAEVEAIEQAVIADEEHADELRSAARRG